MRHIVATLILFSLSIFEVKAEGNCPSGYYPIGGGNAGWTGCAPMNSGSGAGSSEPANPGPSWATRWGAIAADHQAGKLAGVEGLASKREAKRAAIVECKKRGGKKCKVSIAYYNQCGVLVAGDTVANAASGPDIKETTQRAVTQCSQETQNCKSYYSGCSYPERIR